MIECIVGSRADEAGIIAIADEILRLQEEVIVHNGERTLQVEPKACVLLGDRAEILEVAVSRREMGVPIVHIHGGETTGQEPDDTYRHCISMLADYVFVPHEAARQNAVEYDCCSALSVFNMGSPFISNVANTELIDTVEGGYWPDGVGHRVLLAFNPLPEKPMENASIIAGLSLAKMDQYKTLIIDPNTDRHSDALCNSLEKIGKVIDTVEHVEYLSLMNDADIVVGNSSAPIIEGSYLGINYLLVGSRQKYRKLGKNVNWCAPNEIGDRIKRYIHRGKIPCFPYGDADSAKKIANKIMEIFNAGKD
jgi:UDP-N-acetylglucosamine 2-epimerase